MKTTIALFALVAAFHARDARATAPHAMLPLALAKAVAAFDRAQMQCDVSLIARLLADYYVLL